MNPIPISRRMERDAENAATPAKVAALTVGRRIAKGMTECARKCPIAAGPASCLLAKNWLFAKVLQGAKVWVGDPVRINAPWSGASWRPSPKGSAEITEDLIDEFKRTKGYMG